MAHSAKSAFFGGRYLVLTLLLLLVWQVRIVLLVIFVGVLGAVLLRSVSDWTGRKLKLGSRSALVLVLLLGSVAVLSGIWFRGAALADQFATFGERMPAALQAATTRLRQDEWGRWLLSHFGNVQIVPGLAEIFWRATGMISSGVVAFTALVIAFVLSVYVAAEPAVYVSHLLEVVPQSMRMQIQHILDRLFDTLQWWLLARFLSMIAVALIVGIGLWSLGVPMAGTLAVIAGLFTFVPNIGPVISAVPAGLLAFNASPQKALYVVLLFWGAHILEGLVITPLFEKKAVKLPPALTLSMQLILAILAGAAGVALAAPLTLVGLVVTRELGQREQAAAPIRVSPTQRKAPGASAAGG
jgi:predicted PurR-regulated permease PerM